MLSGCGCLLRRSVIWIEFTIGVALPLLLLLLLLLEEVLLLLQEHPVLLLLHLLELQPWLLLLRRLLRRDAISGWLLHDCCLCVSLCVGWQRERNNEVERETVEIALAQSRRLTRSAWKKRAAAREGVGGESTRRSTTTGWQWDRRHTATIHRSLFLPPPPTEALGPHLTHPVAVIVLM